MGAVAGPPPSVTPDQATVYAWLRQSGIDEWLPEKPTVWINATGDRLAYSALVFDGPRGWDTDHIGIGTEVRVVPLAAAPAQNVLDAAARSNVMIVSPAPAGIWTAIGGDVPL
jgi:hypothetical protein